MITKFIEASNQQHNGINWGKFMIARFETHEWGRRSQLEGMGLLGLVDYCGWTPAHVLVFDLQTGEGAFFRPGGLASADLEKHRIWVCPLFEPFLEWLYRQDLRDFNTLPTSVTLNAPSSMSGYRRRGPEPA